MLVKKIYPLLYVLFIFVLYVISVVQILPAWFIHVPLILAFIPIAYRALKKLKHRKVETEFFLVIATVISLIGHQEHAIGIVLIIMLIAEYLEHLIEERTEKEIKSLIDLVPKKALIKKGEHEEFVPLEEVTPGTLVVIKTGGAIPVDGRIVRGQASINESSLTGESVPREKGIGQQVFAGTFVESGSIIINTEKVGESTFFGKINKLVQSADEKKAHITVYTHKIAAFLVPTILVAIFLVWLLTHDITLVTTLLVFGSPLELTLITPLAILSGILAAYRNGVLVKGGLVLERFAQADTLIFDKTGTLTIGEPVIARIQVLKPDFTENEILQIAAIAEKRSDHIVARAILSEAYARNLPVPDPEEYNSLAGHGVEMVYQGKRCFVGNKHFLEAPEHGNIAVVQTLSPFEEETSSFYIGCEDTLYGKIYVSDAVRPQASQTIMALRKAGIERVMMLSGDKKSVANRLAHQLGIQEVHAEVFPDEKLRIIENLQAEKALVAMVGDGINDAPALKQADIGIALGAMGMEPAIEAADIVLVTNDLEKIVFVYRLSQQIFRTIYQNLIVGFLFIHGLGIVLTFLGYVDPFKAALFHAVSDIVILLNSVRLINYKV